MPSAGPAPRMLAYAIDALLMWICLLIFMLTMFLLVPTFAGWLRDLMPDFAVDSTALDPMRVLLPMLLFVMLLSYFGELLYFVFWELVSGGSSPGKRLVGLRVVRLDGLRVDARASWIRNLVRAVDVLPSTYVVGLTTMLISPRGQRLGDLAAGTLVVRLDRPERATELFIRPGLTPLSLSREQMQKLGGRERALVRGTLRRAREGAIDHRDLLLDNAAQALCSRLGLDPTLVDPPEIFLQRLWLAMQRSRG